MEQITIGEIERVLDEKVRGDLALHGGNIRVESLEDGVLHVRLLGQCSGCPSAELTMESLVREELTAAFPTLRSVALVTGVSDELLDAAREMMKKRHE